MSSEQIMNLLPHRYPFALVDRVLEHEPGKRAVAIKNITLNEPQFQGHFPGRPLMPGVLIVEEAGGQVSKLNNDPFNLMEREVVASNGLIHQPLLEQLNREGDSP